MELDRKLKPKKIIIASIGDAGNLRKTRTKSFTVFFHIAFVLHD